MNEPKGRCKVRFKQFHRIKVRIYTNMISDSMDFDGAEVILNNFSFKILARSEDLLR